MYSPRIQSKLSDTRRCRTEPMAPRQDGEPVEWSADAGLASDALW